MKPNFTERFAGWLIIAIIIVFSIYWLIQAWLFVDEMIWNYNDVISRPDYK